MGYKSMRERREREEKSVVREEQQEVKQEPKKTPSKKPSTKKGEDK